MKSKNSAPFKLGVKGLETKLAERPTFWQLFSLIALFCFVFGSVTMVAMVTLKNVVVDILSISGFATTLYLAIRKLIKPRSP